MGTINSALSTPDYLQALLRELQSFVVSVPTPRGLTEIVSAEAKVIRKTTRKVLLYHIKKKCPKIDSARFEPKISLISFYLDRFHILTGVLSWGNEGFGRGCFLIWS